MHLIVYGDFNCPYSYLASQRVDELARLGQAGVEWRAVEHAVQGGDRLVLARVQDARVDLVREDDDVALAGDVRDHF